MRARKPNRFTASDTRAAFSESPSARQASSSIRAIGYQVLTKTRDTTYDNDDLDDAIFRSPVQFFRSFVGFFVRTKNFQKIGRVAAMILVQKSSKSELSSRCFDRSKKKIFVFCCRWCPGGGVSSSGDIVSIGAVSIENCVVFDRKLRFRSKAT